MAQPRLDDPRFTYADYLQWSDDERWELVGGVAHGMSPAPSPRHQEWLVGILVQVARALEGGPCRVYVAPFDVRLAPPGATDGEVEDVVQPDLAVICDRAKIDARGCHGPPDWIVEILSPRTKLRDQVVKRDLYARHGVREYWIVDPDARTLVIYRGDGFGEREEHRTAGRTAVAAVAGVEIDWDRASVD